MIIKENKEALKEEIENVLDQLRTYGLDRRKVEKEIEYAEFSLDQQVSKGGSRKLLAVLRLLLKTQTLQKTISENKNPAPVLPDKPGNENFKDVFEKIDENLRRIEDAVLDAREHTILTESLSQTLVYHSAYLEQRHFGGDYAQIVAVMNEVSESAYKKFRALRRDDHQNKVA